MLNGLQPGTCAYEYLAHLQATSPNEKYRDGRKAIGNASKAKELSGGKYWRYLDTLAAAYAQNGEFEKAQEWQARTIELAATDKLVTERGKQKLRSRLELYRQREPCREEAGKNASEDEAVKIGEE